MGKDNRWTTYTKKQMKELNRLDHELKDLTRRLTILQSGPEGENEQPLEAAP